MNSNKFLISLSILVVVVVTLILTIFVSSSSVEADPLEEEYCCCSSDELTTNAKPLLNVLDELTRQPFFRYFKVNVKKKCPYWVVHIICAQRGNPCKFCRCDAKDIPVSLQTEADMGNALSEDWCESKEGKESESCQQKQPQKEKESTTNDDDFPIDRAMSSAEEEKAATSSKNSNSNKNNNQQQQQQQQNSNSNNKNNNNEIADPKAEYVDLVRNPEGNTFYLGEKPHRVWKAIYEENCLKVVQESSSSEQHPEQCKEKVVFYRLISGLHTSISTHIAAYYHFQKPDPSQLLGEAKNLHPNSPVSLADIPKELAEERHAKRSYALPNCTMFEQRLHSKPQHVANMHFLYRFVIRALTRSRSAFVDPETFQMRSSLKVGNEEEDSKTEKLLEKLFRAHLLCSPTFNESRLLQEPKIAELLPFMKTVIRNMTTITDCISCEKCRLWGKLQLLGLATSFKIVMSPADKVPHLERKELMSLVNLARQLTDSVHNERNMCNDNNNNNNKKEEEEKKNSDL